MFIQSAELTAAPGKSLELVATMTEMRDILTKETGKPWWSWAVLAGRPYGSFAISTRADGFVDIVASQMKLTDSEAWAALAGGVGGVLAHPAETHLAEVIAMTGEPTEPKQFTTVTRAMIAYKDIAQSVAWSCAVMEHSTKVTGQVGTAALTAAGSMFQVYWFGGSDTPEGVDAARQAIATDEEYQGMIAQAGADGLFVDGSVESMMIVKMP